MPSGEVLEKQGFVTWVAVLLLIGLTVLVGGLLRHVIQTDTYIRGTLLEQAKAVTIALTRNEDAMEKMVDTLAESNRSIMRLVMMLESDRHRTGTGTSKAHTDG